MNKAVNDYIEKGMDLTVFEGSKIASTNMLFGISKTEADLIRYTKEITVFGKHWTVLFRGDGSFKEGVKWHPPIASTVGLLLLFLLISIIFEINDFRTRHRMLSENNKQLEQLSNLDSLTGIANRRYFDESLGKELKRSCRDKTPLSLILLDIDNFKEFNDTFGHLAGDECLRQVAQILRKAIERSHDLVARYGGEEFAVILPSTDLKGGLIIAERLRTLVEDLDLTSPKASVIRPLTISLGLASTPPGQKNLTPQALIGYADKALYEAKKQGKNRTVHLDLPVHSFTS